MPDSRAAARKPVSIVLVAIGGYGGTYVGLLLDDTDPGAYRLEGIVDPTPARCNRLADLTGRGVPTCLGHCH